MLFQYHLVNVISEKFVIVLIFVPLRTGGFNFFFPPYYLIMKCLSVVFFVKSCLGDITLLSLWICCFHVTWKIIS